MNTQEKQQQQAATPVLESAMETGQDDEPEMTIGDKHTGDAPRELSVEEADDLLGGESGNSSTQTKKKIEGKDGDNI